MPNYRVKSGELKCVVKTKYDAELKSIATMAIERNPQINAFGLLMQVRGGEYIKNNVGYLNTKYVLQSMGEVKP